jgi:metal transporter CNNM
MVNSRTTSFATQEDLIYAGCALICVVCAASAAGMTMGLLSIDTLKLKIKLQVGTEQERVYAKRVLPLLKNHHWLLCSLLIYNAAANEALPIFLDALVPSVWAIIISVTLVLLFGEVIPTALFTGPNQLAIAANFAGLARFVQLVFSPVSYPMSLLLDYLLGREEQTEIYTRDEISAMLNIIRSNAMNLKYFYDDGWGGADEESEEGEEPLTNNEVLVMTGVLGLAKKCIRDVAIPMSKVNMLSSDQVLDSKTIATIEQVGHSRLPVFSGQDTTNILGFFLVKRLISINPEKAIPLASMELKPPLVVGAGQSLLDVLNVFQTGHSHMALVSEQPEELRAAIVMHEPPSSDASPIGILTIEDIFEAMIQSQILDEDDMDKGHIQEEASMALREMSLRSSLPSLSMGGTPGTGTGVSMVEGVGAGSGGGDTGTGFGATVHMPTPQQRELAAAVAAGPPLPKDDVPFRRAVTDHPGGRFSVRALSEAPEKMLARRLSGGTLSAVKGGSGNEAKWLSQRASTRSMGHHSDGASSSLNAPLLEAHQHHSQDVEGVGIQRLGTKITPSLVAKYLKKRGGTAGGQKGGGVKSGDPHHSIDVSNK